MSTTTASRPRSAATGCRPGGPGTPRRSNRASCAGTTRSWRQHLHLPEVFAPYAAGQRGRGWLALIDVDEFIVLTRHGSIGELTAEATAPRLRFLNFNVDTSGHDPSRPVLEQHTVRWSREDVLAHPLKRWARRVKSIVRHRCARLETTVHKISRGPHVLLDPEVARLHHFKMPPNTELDIPFTVDDPVRLPTERRSEAGE